MKHKWHKEIKAWADGAEIEAIFNGEFDWQLIEREPFWNDENVTFRIKSQPKEPQYLYVYKTVNGIEFGTVGMAFIVNSSTDKFECIGKIKLELENE